MISELNGQQHNHKQTKKSGDTKVDITLRPSKFVKFKPKTRCGYLTAHNNTKRDILFKVDTKSSDLFEISPRFVLLEPGELSRIKIKLNAKTDFLNNQSVSTDKFTVRYLFPDEHDIEIGRHYDRIRVLFDLDNDLEIANAFKNSTKLKKEAELTRQLINIIALVITPLAIVGLYVLAKY